MLFGGVPSIPSSEVFARARANQPREYRVLEEAYAQFAARPENVGVYADPKGKGATVEQAWMLFTLFGIEPFCLLARDLPAAQIGRISRVVRCEAGEIIRHFKSIQAIEGRIGATTLHYDGATGHCICVRSYDESGDRFVYYDPWPEDSLLCGKNNEAGVEARREGNYWSVTAAELESVLFASFVFPAQWARCNGTRFDLTLEGWKASEFFNFFHVKETGKQQSEDGLARVFSVGSFKDAIALRVETGARDRIVRASLVQSRRWMTANLHLALDLVKSFVGCFAPAPERSAYEAIRRAVWSLRDAAAAKAFAAPDGDSSVAASFVRGFTGLTRSALVNTEFASLSLENVGDESGGQQRIDFTLR